jgi:hypothetical protein
VLGLDNFSAYYDPAVGRLRRRPRVLRARQRRLLLLSKFLMCNTSHYPSSHAVYQSSTQFIGLRLILFSKFLMCNTSHYPSSHAVYQSSTQFIGLRLILFSKFLMCNTSHYSSSGGYNSKAVASLCYSTSCIAGHSIPS